MEYDLTEAASPHTARAEDLEAERRRATMAHWPTARLLAQALRAAMESCGLDPGRVPELGDTPDAGALARLHTAMHAGWTSTSADYPFSLFLRSSIWRFCDQVAVGEVTELTSACVHSVFATLATVLDEGHPEVTLAVRLAGAGVADPHRVVVAAMA